MRDTREQAEGGEPGAILGPDGAATLVLSLLAIAATGGLSLLAVLARVLHVGWTAHDVVQPDAAPPATPPPATPLPARQIVVLGRRLDARGRPGAVFQARLARALALWRAAGPAEIVVLGGRARGAAASEAAAGRAWLLARGVPEAAIRIEDRSRHTLENLRCYRAGFAVAGAPALLVSSRVHLARVRLMAHGLALPHSLCAAEARQAAALRLPDLLAEAFFVHWYLVGRGFARRTGNARMLRRIG